MMRDRIGPSVAEVKRRLTIPGYLGSNKVSWISSPKTSDRIENISAAFRFHLRLRLSW
jgi:hypothetical protein